MSPTATERKPIGRPRSRESHDAILAATLELLAEGGYSAMTVDEVAARSGTGKATIYRRWPSKLHLTIAAFEKLPKLMPVDAGNVGKDLETLVRRFVELLATTPLGKVFPSLLGDGAHDPELLAMIAPIFDQRRDPCREVLRRALARGELKVGTDLEALIDAAMGPVMLRFFLDGAAPSRQYVRQAVSSALAPHLNS